MQIALSVGFKILPGVTFTELITQYFKVTGKLNQVYLEHCSNVFACACAFNSPLWLLSELFCREHRSLQLNEPRANDSSFWFLWIIDDSFSPASKSYFLSPLFDTEVFMRATWFEWLKTTSPPPTIWLIMAALQFLPYYTPFLDVKVIQLQCSRSISLFLFLSQHRVSLSSFYLPTARPHSLSCSFHWVEYLSASPPFFPFRKGFCRGTPPLSHLWALYSFSTRSPPLH